MENISENQTENQTDFQQKWVKKSTNFGKIRQHSHEFMKNCLMWTKVTQKGQNSPQIAKK